MVVAIGPHPPLACPSRAHPGVVWGAVVLSRYHGVAPYGGIVVGIKSADKLMDEVAEWICRHKY